MTAVASFGRGVVALALVYAGIAALPARAETDEVRGLWVLRTSLSSARSIDAVVRTAESSGFNTLMVQVRGRGEAFYTSALEPRATELDGQPAAFDPLAYMVAAAHGAGLRVHAWVNVGLVSSAATLPRSRNHVVSRHPEWLMVPKQIAGALRGVDVRSPAYVGQLARWTRAASTTVEGLYLSPMTDAAQDYTVSVVNEIVSRYPIDGLHLDYARYPNELFDYSARALGAFRELKAPAVALRERQRLDQAALRDPAAWANMFPEGWAAFRRDRLTTLIRRVHDGAKAARPAIVVSAAVAPDAQGARDHAYQDWSAWASARLVDAICPMAYTSNLADFSAVVTRARASAAGLPIWAGIGAWQLPSDRAVEHVRAARRAGVSGVLLFSYDALTASDAAPSAYFANLRQAFLETIPE
jgi:uncharacterized lipoprotein YddW (UPF0748 family)